MPGGSCLCNARRSKAEPQPLFFAQCQVHPVYVKGFFANYLTIINDVTSPNTDGIDPDSTQDVLITNCYIHTGACTCRGVSDRKKRMFFLHGSLSPQSSHAFLCFFFFLFFCFLCHLLPLPPTTRAHPRPPCANRGRQHCHQERLGPVRLRLRRSLPQHYHSKLHLYFALLRGRLHRWARRDSRLPHRCRAPQLAHGLSLWRTRSPQARKCRAVWPMCT